MLVLWILSQSDSTLQTAAAAAAAAYTENLFLRKMCSFLGLLGPLTAPLQAQKDAALAFTAVVMWVLARLMRGLSRASSHMPNNLHFFLGTGIQQGQQHLHQQAGC